MSSCPSVAGEKHCAATHPNIRRFCACVPEPTAPPTTTTAAPVTARRQARNAGDASLSSAVLIAGPDRFTTVLLPLLAYVSLSLGGGGSKAAVLGGMALALASWPAPASAHNWMFTPSRATGQASTTGPCRGRRSPDTKHAQASVSSAAPLSSVLFYFLPLSSVSSASYHRASSRKACLRNSFAAHVACWVHSA